MAVALRVEHPPELSDLAADPPQISVTPCRDTTTLVGATVTDESPLGSVTLRWGGQSARRFGSSPARRIPLRTWKGSPASDPITCPGGVDRSSGH